MGERSSSDLYVSALTLAELERGIVRLPASRRRNELTTWLANVQAGLGQRALPFTRDTAGYWARLCAQAEAAGKPMAAFDSLQNCPQISAHAVSCTTSLATSSFVARSRPSSNM
jgi:predicted nucleic acid-binding protein